MNDVPLLRQVPEEFDKLRAIFLERQPRRILEIGVWEGGTLWEWVANAPSGATVVALDYFAEDVPQQARESFHGWRSDAKLVSIAGDSTTRATIDRVREHAPFDWVFIDGSHVYADVLADWTNYGLTMVDSGVVAFHDIAPHTRPGFDSEADRVWELVKTWASGYGQRQWTRTEEIIAEPPQGWAGIGVVYIGEPRVLYGDFESYYLGPE